MYSRIMFILSLKEVPFFLVITCFVSETSRKNAAVFVKLAVAIIPSHSVYLV